MLSRRMFLNRSTVLALGAGGAAAMLTSEKSQAGATLAQAQVGYQEQPKGPQRCEVCTRFVAPNACKLVAGEISPQGWCRFFSVTG